MLPKWVEIARSLNDDKSALLDFSEDVTGYVFTMVVTGLPAISGVVQSAPDGLVLFALDASYTATAGVKPYVITADAGPGKTFTIGTGAVVVVDPLSTVPGGIGWEMVTMVAPAMRNVAALDRLTILAFVNGSGVNADAFGDDLGLARAYLAAHICQINRLAAKGAAGLVSSQTVGSISRTYAAQSAPALLGGTPYGVAFASLANTGLARLPIVL